jgi:hypothetical protein
VTNTEDVDRAARLLVRKYRRNMEWSIKDLAQACWSCGHTHLTVTALLNLERGLLTPTASGRPGRRLTVADVYALADAFGVQPTELLP